MQKTFVPKLLTVLQEGITRQQVFKDITAGVIVGIVALPLSIAFAIASGVPPEKGLYTAIIAGFIIAAFGGSRVQIGGPTGAFIVIVYGIVQEYGVPGLTAATLIAGVIILLMGFARLGSVLKYIPYSLVVGFTSGIALIIFSSQIKDFLGLKMGPVPSEFIEKWVAYFENFGSVNTYAIVIAAGTVVITLLFSKITNKIPGSLVAIILATLAVQHFQLPVETIASRFGSIPSELPAPEAPALSLADIRRLIAPAFTIAFLGAIESLLSAVVSDGMIGGSHRSNMELVAQGLANIGSAIFGGIPATGAIARTATNVKNGGRTPIAGMVHAITLLVIMLFVGQWAKLIPMACLAGILVVVAYNMSEWHAFVALVKGPKHDVIVLLTAFFLTVLVDLTVAIEIGVVLAAFLFMRRMAKISEVTAVSELAGAEQLDDEITFAAEHVEQLAGVQVFEVNGPLFFGAAHKFKETMGKINVRPKIIVFRLRHVPFIDATGLYNLKTMIKELQAKKIEVVLSGVRPGVLEELQKSDIVALIGEGRLAENIQMAMVIVKGILT